MSAGTLENFDRQRLAEEAARHDAEWGRACRTWGNWGRIAAREAVAEPVPPEPDGALGDDFDEEADAFEIALNAE